MKPQFHINNRKKLSQKSESSLIVIPANGLLQRSADTTYPFQQDSDFWYLTGVQEPDIILVIDNDEEYLILPEVGKVQAVLDASIDLKKIISTSGITRVYESRQGWSKLRLSIQKNKHIGITEPNKPFMKDFGFYVNPTRKFIKQKIKRINSSVVFEDMRPILAEMRLIKQPEEIEKIQQAIDISIISYKDVVRNITNYRYEYEVEADLTRGIRARGASGHAFSPIVASGKNATTIHSFSNDGPINKDDLLLIDFGAEVSHYTADIARTCAISKSNKRQRMVVEAVARVQQFAISLLKPGLSFMDYEIAVEKQMGIELKALGLIHEQTRQNIRQFFPHATSHYLGLDTHDVGDRRDATFKENMVLAVEPSILIEKEGIGVRIEDDVLITKQANKNLSAKLPTMLQ